MTTVSPRWSPNAVLLLVLALLSGCASAPPLAEASMRGDYRHVALCTRAGLLATDRDLLFAEDREQKVAWISHERSDVGPGLRGFRVAFRQATDQDVVVEVLSVSGISFDQDVFFTRLNSILGGCGKP